MALVNTAVELAKRGRKILIVDFDLEAPGLPTYSPFTSLHNSPGIVEYVTKYIDTAAAPRAIDFIAKCNVGDTNIWVMPAGKRDAHYASRFTSIDWQSLYADHQGYLMFEDLKEQWKEQQFDYVLIDSRTGHTDVGGICTRHLPNSVVIMFFPNDQNLIGLESIIREIREESLAKDHPKIALHFCASNVPDLDDEENILEKKLSEAGTRLGIDEAPIVIHHYNSLTLLEQSIFVEDRPTSKLTKEYLDLVDVIISANDEDREGALATLSDFRTFSRLTISSENADDVFVRINRILDIHPNDGELAYEASRFFKDFGDFKKELECLNVAIKNNFSTIRALLRRAEIARIEGRQVDILSDLEEVLKTPRISSFDLIKAIELLRVVDKKNWIQRLENSNLFETLNTRSLQRVIDVLMAGPDADKLVTALITKYQVIKKTDSSQSESESELTLSLLKSGRFKAAIGEFGLDRSHVLKLENIGAVFNYAMAEWGLSGKPPVDLMKRVLELSRSTDRSARDQVNFYQCLALTCSVCGDKTSAKSHLNVARKELRDYRNSRLRRERRMHPLFSCWRYSEVTILGMQEDLFALEKFIEGEAVQPLVFSKRVGSTNTPTQLPYSK